MTSVPAQAGTESNLPNPAMGGEAFLHQGGRDFLLAFYAALRNLKLYPVENEQVQRSLDTLTSAAEALLVQEYELEIRLAGEFVFVNSTRLRLDIGNYASFGHVLGTLRHAQIGVVRVGESVTRREWQVFVALLLAAATQERAGDQLSVLTQRMLQGGVTNIAVESPVEGESDEDEEEQQREYAKRTYERSVDVTKDLVNSARMGRSASVRKVKRAVQGIVDQVLNNETSMVGLTTIRHYDDYTFVHSVNVCIFSVSIGKRLGLSKLQLFDLGMAALLHDLGKSRIPTEVLNKQAKLTDEEWAAIQCHPWLGVISLFGLRGCGELPYRAMITAHEHHMKTDLTGYPKSKRPRKMSMYSKLIAVADVFDAATSKRDYRTRDPITPDQVLHEMRTMPHLGLDQVLVKALINLVGVYPIGTCVILDTYEMGVVHAVNPETNRLNRPIVRIITTPEGAIVERGPLENLAETNADGSFKKSIIKVTDPEKYNINVADYFV